MSNYTPTFIIEPKLLEKCLEFREEDLCHVDEYDKKYLPNFDYYSKKILKNTTKKVYNYVSKKLDSMYDDFIDYYSYIITVIGMIRII